MKGIPYSAPPTHWNIWTGGLRQSIDTGAQLLVAAITEAIAAAPDRQLVVIGLSQGAASVHIALPQIAALDDAVLDRVAAILLYADPLRVGGDPSNWPPSAHHGALARVWDLRIPTPQALRSHVLSFCGAEGMVDPVCDFRPGLRTLLGLYANPVHITYDDPERPSGWIGPEFAVNQILGNR
jgi:hypothetical protein